MSGSDPIVFAARAASLTDRQLREEWKAVAQKVKDPDWRQALRDELAARQARTEPQSSHS